MKLLHNGLSEIDVMTYFSMWWIFPFEDLVTLTYEAFRDGEALVWRHLPTGIKRTLLGWPSICGEALGMGRVAGLEVKVEQIKREHVNLMIKVEALTREGIESWSMVGSVIVVAKNTNKMDEEA
ncbi:hypothetical protein GUJ93_ZPchr0001g29775 [Zizania palustris]|uniref:Uncharacterized protein n=1 Tax=Zizania palustris TaxID=103762 RepID=A0A8J5RNE8_ZIZPA|nr:hypothetical protein GUJ93_ZPchr0001g29775 [Zizania palustris]